MTANNTVDVFSFDEPGRIERVEIKIVGEHPDQRVAAVKVKGDVKTLGATATVHYVKVKFTVGADDLVRKGKGV